MPEMILHHYDLSPFSEKVRLAFGLKRLAWRSVEVPIWMPKPPLMPLIGGYRRLPAATGGRRSCRWAPISSATRSSSCTRSSGAAPTLYPGQQVGLASALSLWVETRTFVPAASLATSVIGDQLPPEFIEERRSFMNHDFTKERSLQDLPLNRARMNGALAWLIDMMHDGRPYLLGAEPSAADLSAYHTIWFARKHGGTTVEAMLAPRSRRCCRSPRCRPGWTGSPPSAMASAWP